MDISVGTLFLFTAIVPFCWILFCVYVVRCLRVILISWISSHFWTCGLAMAMPCCRLRLFAFCFFFAFLLLLCCCPRALALLSPCSRCRDLTSLLWPPSPCSVVASILPSLLAALLLPRCCRLRWDLGSPLSVGLLSEFANTRSVDVAGGRVLL